MTVRKRYITNITQHKPATLNNENPKKNPPPSSSKRAERVSYDSLAQTLHSQEPLAKAVRQLGHTSCLHILHWLEKRLRKLMGSRHLPQLR